MKPAATIFYPAEAKRHSALVAIVCAISLACATVFAQSVPFDGKIPVYPNAEPVIGAKAPTAAEWAQGISGTFLTPDPEKLVTSWYLDHVSGCSVRSNPDAAPGTTVDCPNKGTIGVVERMRGGKKVTAVLILPDN